MRGAGLRGVRGPLRHPEGRAPGGVSAPSRSATRGTASPAFGAVTGVTSR
ncbi:predicted protein [Streptomyces sp. SPB78]|nr:predicted protein [Streptomyces sp. SPB78]